MFFQNLSLRGKILVSFLESIVLLALYLAGIAALGSWQVPSSWAVNAIAATGVPIDPLNQEDIFWTAGVLFGMGAGYSWLFRRRGFSSKGSAVARLIRFIFGIAGLVLIWYGIEAIGLHQTLPVRYVIDHTGGAAASIWVTAIAPILFVRAGLSKRETKDCVSLDGKQ